MQTVHINTYADFVKAGRPYLPKLDATGRLLLCNFESKPDVRTNQHKKCLIIGSGTFYNHNGLCAVWYCALCSVGYRWRYLYWRGSQRLTWPKLSWEEKRRIARAYVKNAAAIPIFEAPSKDIKKWAIL